MEEEVSHGLTSLASHVSWGSNDLRPRTLRKLLGAYPTGVAVVTTRAPNGRQIGLTINSFVSLSLEPALVLWSLGNNSSNLAAFANCSHFSINILSNKQEAIARRFANSRLPDKFAEVPLRQTPEGMPIIDEALSVLICIHDHCRTVGDHLLLVGRVVRTNDFPGVPLVFCGGRFLSSPRPDRSHGKLELDSARRRRPSKKEIDSEAATVAWNALMESEHGV